MSHSRLAIVLARACLRRHLAISAWLPDRSTSGTRSPCHSSGRVKCGQSSNPSENESCDALPASFRLPGRSRTTASITTIAGSSPPEVT